MNDGNDMGCTYKRFKPLEEEIKDKKIEKIKHEIKINGGKVKRKRYKINTIILQLSHYLILFYSI